MKYQRDIKSRRKSHLYLKDPFERIDNEMETMNGYFQQTALGWESECLFHEIHVMDF